MPIRCLALLALALVIAACSTSGSNSGLAEQQKPVGPGKVTPEQIQSEVMTFADTYAAIAGQAFRYLLDTAATPEERLSFHRIRLSAIESVTEVATNANPFVALLDMVVLVTLQRVMLEEYWIPEVAGERLQPLLEDIQELEIEIWDIASKAINQSQQSELQTLIDDMRKQYPNLVWFDTVRASEFAAVRAAPVVSKEKGGGSLFQLFRLDPLANLTPAAREIAQTRLLAERAFFYGKRMPLFVRWHIEQAALTGFTLPETKQLLNNTQLASEAAKRASAALDRIVDGFSEEREAAIDQFSQRLTEEREAAINQASEELFTGLTEQRQAIEQALDQDHNQLRGTMLELRQTVDASSRLATELQETLAAGADLTTGIKSLQSTDPDRPQASITDYQATLTAATETIQQLNSLINALNTLLQSPDWSARQSQFTSAADNVDQRARILIDRLFFRGLLLIGAALLAALIYRLLTLRFPRRSAAATN